MPSRSVAAPEVGAAGDADLALPLQAPGWFPDQVNGTLQRYWHGQAWSAPAEPVPSVDRDQTAAAHDEIAETIDRAAADRDQRSEARDKRADRRAHAAPVADGRCL